MKKIILIICILLISLTACNKLPKPSIESGIRGELGIDAKINEKTIDNYLGRDDSIYIDLRMLEDEANYEAIGGDSFISGYIKGFEIIPYPYICNPIDLPEEVGKGYTGDALFSYVDGIYIENYEESLSILNDLFPKNKKIFLMCGGGGYAGMMKKLLVALGYESNQIYNIGGYWYYDGDNNINIKNENNGEIDYNFDLLKYHEIDFDNLNPKDGYIPKGTDINSEVDENPVSEKMIEIKTYDEFIKTQEDKKTYLLYVYLPGCISCASFKQIVEEFIEINDVTVYQLNYKVIKDNDNIIKRSISYTPSLFIFKDGKCLAYLNPVGDVDKDKYHNTENLSKWINEYINVDIVKTNSENNVECSDDACKL